MKNTKNQQKKKTVKKKRCPICLRKTKGRTCPICKGNKKYEFWYKYTYFQSIAFLIQAIAAFIILIFTESIFSAIIISFSILILSKAFRDLDKNLIKYDAIIISLFIALICLFMVIGSKNIIKSFILAVVMIVDILPAILYVKYRNIIKEDQK